MSIDFQMWCVHLNAGKNTFYFTRGRIGSTPFRTYNFTLAVNKTKQIHTEPVLESMHCMRLEIKVTRTHPYVQYITYVCCMYVRNTQ